MLWETRIQRTFPLVICDFVINSTDLYNACGIVLLIILFPLFENSYSVLPSNIKQSKVFIIICFQGILIHVFLISLNCFYLNKLLF